MTVKELIEKLQEMPDKSRHVYTHHDRHLDHIESVEIDGDNDVILFAED